MKRRLAVGNSQPSPLASLLHSRRAAIPATPPLSPSARATRRRPGHPSPIHLKCQTHQIQIPPPWSRATWGAPPNPKREKLAGGGGKEDRLSALPDDILIHIFFRLRDTAFAARTSILSRRWRRLRALLPEIHFSDATDPRSILPAVVAYEAPVLRRLVAVVLDASPYSVATCLQIVAPRLSGDLIFRNVMHSEYEERGTLELPCFEKATSIKLDLGFLGLTMPASGVFAQLTDLCLDHVWIYGPCGLGDFISSPRCPALQKLTIHDARCTGNFTIYSGSLHQMKMRNLKGFSKLTIHSDSLLQMELSDLRDLHQLTVVAPALEELALSSCFSTVFSLRLLMELAVSISAPQLLILKWRNTWYRPYGCFFKLAKMADLHCLDIGVFVAYGLDSDAIRYNASIHRLLKRFKVIHKLNLTVDYLPPDMDDNQYFMEDMKRLPEITILSIVVTARAHSFGTCLFHVLRMCTGVRKLMLDTPCHFDFQECPSDCFCGQPSNWKSEELVLDRLQEVEISNLRGTGHEVAFAERLFSWAMALEQMTVTFDESITESMAMKEFCQKLLCFSRPGICMKFFVYSRCEKVLYVPED